MVFLNGIIFSKHNLFYGIFYTVGIVFYVIKKIRYFHILKETYIVCLSFALCKCYEVKKKNICMEKDKKDVKI